MISDRVAHGPLIIMSQPWNWFVYIIECLDGTYYTGCTWNLENRVGQHASGHGSKYTARHGFKRFVYAERYESLEAARIREKQLKDWSQEKKRKLIGGEWKQPW